MYIFFWLCTRVLLRTGCVLADSSWRQLSLFSRLIIGNSELAFVYLCCQSILIPIIHSSACAYYYSESGKLARLM